MRWLLFQCCAVFLCVSVAGAHLSLEGSFISLYLQMLFFPLVLSFLFLCFYCVESLDLLNVALCVVLH